MSAPTSCRYDAFVRACARRGGARARVSQPQSRLLSLARGPSRALLLPCFRLRRVPCRMSRSLLLARALPLFAPISLVPLRLRLPLSTVPLPPHLAPSSRRSVGAIARDILARSPSVLLARGFFRFICARRVHFAVISFLLSSSSSMTSHAASSRSFRPSLLSRPLLQFFSVHFSFIPYSRLPPSHPASARSSSFLPSVSLPC